MIRCEDCRRHIRLTERICPFCDAEQPRRTRSAVLAAGIALLSGCPAPVDVYGAPPEPVDAAIDARLPDGGAPDAQASRSPEHLGPRGRALAVALTEEDPR